MDLREKHMMQNNKICMTLGLVIHFFIILATILYKGIFLGLIYSDPSFEIGKFSFCTF